jgi:hypothetical protein
MPGNPLHAPTRTRQIAGLPSEPRAARDKDLREKPSCQVEADIYNRAVTASPWNVKMRAQ